MPFTVRPAEPRDAAALAALIDALNVHEGKKPVFSRERVLRDVFDNKWVSVLVAESEGELIGYAMYAPLYNTDLAEPGLWLNDLFVADGARGGGAGRALLAGVARAAMDGGFCSVWWSVRNANTKARRLYERLGATDDDARILGIDGDALQRLAATA